MSIIDVELIQESKNRYLTYALSVVNGRTLPDIRDGLKPVQRRILYAMSHNLHLTPEKTHRKSAAVIGEVLARYHPHGDVACYEAMARMAQDFNFRYPLVDGQGNFGSIDGDNPAAYRYTEARLKPIALEVIGDITEETVPERDNFDQTTKEPVVFPSRIPNLLLNGCMGIAVGLATSCPPHNLSEVIKALLLYIEDPELGLKKLLSIIKGPDFPTGCSILNTKEELVKIYSSGKGAIRMRSDYQIEDLGRGKKAVIVTSIPYTVDKSILVEKIADLIATRKVPQFVDIRDESTKDIRIVLELAPEADAEKAMAFLFKNTPLQLNFNVNLTALIPTANPLTGRPVTVGLLHILKEFINFRVIVTRNKLLFEKQKLDERIHLLVGLVRVLDALDEALKIVRKSTGRADAAEALQKRFKLTEKQSYFVVDMHIYQLSQTSITEILAELKAKQNRVHEIEKILKNERELKKLIAQDLTRINESYGDARRSKLVHEFEEVEIVADDFVQHEDVYVLVTKDGWIKRIRQNNDPQSARLREGDSLFFTAPASTKDSLIIFSSLGCLYSIKVNELVSTTGFGEPVQKMFKFADGETIVQAGIMTKDELQAIESQQEILLWTKKGLGFRVNKSILSDTKRTGKKLIKLTDKDKLGGVLEINPEKKFFFLLSQAGYALLFAKNEVPILSGVAKGVILQRMPDEDKLIGVLGVDKKELITIELEKGLNQTSVQEFGICSLTIATRSRRGEKIIKKGFVKRIRNQEISKK
ncbi:MAG: DNA topoisomerase 4 subunit A [Deltaproteobacteria bacterium]|jgi:DNA gyrase subunit A|nr:DNA topoisomerase 4 subunit A [Deltaproteobacteria bacterium]